MPLLCSMCVLQFNSISHLRRHLRFIHKLDDNRAFKCAEVGCYQQCSNWDSFRRHLNKFHIGTVDNTSYSVSTIPEILVPSISSNQNLHSDASHSNDPRDVDVNDNFSSSTHGSNPEVSSLDTFSVSEASLDDQIKTYASSFICRMYSKSSLSRKIVQEYIEDTSDFLSTSISKLSHDIVAELKSQNIDSNIIDAICLRLTLLKDPFKNLHSEYLRLQFLEKLGLYIAPEPYVIGSDIFTKDINGKRVLELDKINGQFIRLRTVFKCFLELPNVFDVIMNSLNGTSNECLVADYIHGSHWQRKKVLFGEKLVIPVFIFYDDFEVDKEIGSHSAKLGAVYIKIACLPAEFQSSLDNIFVALLFNTSDRINYGNKATFGKLITELNFLFNNGIKITVNGVIRTVYFVIGLVVADNLALHSLLGFAEGFTANFPCRFCRAHRSLINIQTEEISSLLRNKVQHTIDCNIGNVSLSGVNEESVLSDVETFEVTDNPSVDIMHDVFEGVCVYDMGHILYDFIFVKRYFTLETLNFQLIAFDYDKTITNKPTTFKEKVLRNRQVKMTASEMRTFVRIFALLVGDFIPDNEPIWKFYLILRDIIDILLCRQVQNEIIIVLKEKIKEHHRLYVDLFHDSLKPKHHYMVHYPFIMSQSGALVNLACDRFESNHQLSVQDAKAIKSRKNIAYTLAVKQQLRCAYRFMTRKGLDTALEVGPEEEADYAPSFLPQNFKNNFMQHAFVRFKGTLYKRGMCVVIGVDNDNGPKFGIISSVIVNVDGNVCLVCNVLSSVMYSEHLHAYNVIETSKVVSILIIDLLDYVPLLFSRVNGKKYVTLHHLL